MREIRTSGSMSGPGKPGGYAAAPQLDSTPSSVPPLAATRALSQHPTASAQVLGQRLSYAGRRKRQGPGWDDRGPLLQVAAPVETLPIAEVASSRAAAPSCSPCTREACV